jgi:hypothetical protein
MFVVVHQLDGTFACLPVWMTDEAASRFEIGDEPRFPLDVLRSLRNEVDALLGFLVSESQTERAENDAHSKRKEDLNQLRCGRVSRKVRSLNSRKIAKVARKVAAALINEKPRRVGDRGCGPCAVSRGDAALIQARCNGPQRGGPCDRLFG